MIYVFRGAKVMKNNYLMALMVEKFGYLINS